MACTNPVRLQKDFSISSLKATEPRGGGGGHWTKSSCRPKSRIPHSSGKNFPDSGISISLHEAIPGFLILMLNDVKFRAFAHISPDKYL